MLSFAAVNRCWVTPSPPPNRPPPSPSLGVSDLLACPWGHFSLQLPGRDFDPSGNCSGNLCPQGCDGVWGPPSRTPASWGGHSAGMGGAADCVIMGIETNRGRKHRAAPAPDPLGLCISQMSWIRDGTGAGKELHHPASSCARYRG